MRSKKKQLKEDIRFCIDECEMTDESVGEMLRASEKLGVSCEYFAEEFIFDCDDTDVMKYHDESYLQLPNFGNTK